LSVSIRAAALVGEAAGMPASLKASTMPTSREASGPTTSISMPCSRAHAKTAGTSRSSISLCAALIPAMPGLRFFMTE
jgi:hypothetical protein